MTPAIGHNGEPALLPDEWLAYFAGLVGRLREHALEVVDAYDAAIDLRSILIAAELPERTLGWSEIVTTQATTLDALELESKFTRATRPVLPKEHTR